MKLTGPATDTIEQQRVNYRDSPVVTGTGHTLRAATFFTSLGTHIAARGCIGKLPPTYHGFVASSSPSEIDPPTIATGIPHGVTVTVRPDGYVGRIGADTSHATRPWTAALKA